MKKFLKKTIAFSVFALTAYCIFIILLGEFAPYYFLKKNLNYKLGANGHLFSRTRQATAATDVDILFLGSSHAYRGFDPRVFQEYGYTSFNLGSSAQTPVQTKVLLERYLDRLNPKLVIYEVFPGSFGSDGVESALDVIANDQNDRHSIWMAFKTNHIKVYNTLIYAFYRDRFNRNAGFVEQEQREVDTYVDGGFVEREMKNYTPRTFNPREWKFKSHQFKVFEDVLDVLHEKQIDVVLVMAPMTSCLYEAHLDRSEYDKRMAGYGRYYNFNEFLELDDAKHFYDAHHLNQDGVQIFNQKVVDVIFKNTDSATSVAEYE
jgi:hypothetical protein